VPAEALKAQPKTRLVSEHRLERRKELGLKMLPFVSVIVPCRNEAFSIVRCLESILASNYPADRMEVVVADGMSADGSRDLLETISRTDPRVRIIDNPARTTPIALNRAIAAARGELILRIDAHSVIDPNYIVELVRFLETHPEAWGAGGRMFTVPETPGLFADAISIVLRHKFGVGNSEFRTNVGLSEPRAVDTVFNCCWRREVFERVGLFHEQLERSQDIEMSTRIARVGGTLWLVPRAATTYFARVRFRQYLRHNWSNGVWSLVPAIYLGRLPVRWRHLIPLAFVVTLAASFMFAALGIVPIWVSSIPAFSYLLANFAASFSEALTARDARLALLLLAAFAALHISYGAGSFWGALRLIAHFLRASLRRLNPQPSYDSSPNPKHSIF
jgi:cellulose synthase/poly-beta-1,6-N-acetylglucosamine synthase-like glycosyltransferase